MGVKTTKKEKKLTEYKKERKSNGYGVNQFTIEDPRQRLFFKLYYDINSDSFSNCYKTALKCGYSENYAKELLSIKPKWLLDYQRKLGNSSEEIVKQAENNIKEVLTLDTTNSFTSKDGTVYTKLDTDLLRIKDNTSKWALERLNKDKYSSRTEHISKNLTIIQNIEQNIKDIANGEVITENKGPDDHTPPDQATP